MGCTRRCSAATERIPFFCQCLAANTNSAYAAPIEKARPVKSGTKLESPSTAHLSSTQQPVLKDLSVPVQPKGAAWVGTMLPPNSTTNHKRKRQSGEGEEAKPRKKLPAPKAAPN